MRDTIDQATAAATFARWRGASPKTLVPLAGGLRNAVFRADGWVIRFYLHDPKGCEREGTALRMLHGSRVPVPELVHVESSDPPVTICTYVEGVPFQTLDLEGRKAAAPSIGFALAQMMMHPGSGPTRSIETELATALASPALHARLGQSVAALERLASTALVATDTRLVHGDFRKWNVIVRDGRCAAIIDWEHAGSGSPMGDIGLFLRYERDGHPRFGRELAAGLVDGGAELPDDWRRQSRIADLASVCTSLARAALPNDIVSELVAVARGVVEDLGG
jgi:aminoglycoside phosphotransferase (APT) family kinase protein